MIAMVTNIRQRALVGVLLVAVTTTARAQCPDGAPPPCKGAMPAALRRVNPPLDARAWIVVPFANITKSQDLDWLRDASVNLLSLDLSRWTDIKVVDDKRVADLLRELPSARSVAMLTLNDGLALARRAGASTDARLPESVVATGGVAEHRLPVR